MGDAPTLKTVLDCPSKRKCWRSRTVHCRWKSLLDLGMTPCPRWEVQVEPCGMDVGSFLFPLYSCLWPWPVNLDHAWHFKWYVQHFSWECVWHVYFLVWCNGDREGTSLHKSEQIKTRSRFSGLLYSPPHPPPPLFPNGALFNFPVLPPKPYTGSSFEQHFCPVVLFFFFWGGGGCDLHLQPDMTVMV